MKKIYLIVSLLCITLLLTSCTGQAVGGVESSVQEEGDIKTVKVTQGTADIRSGCSDDAPILQSSNQDEVLNVVNDVDDWYAVRLEDQEIGFVPKDNVTPVVTDDLDIEDTDESPNNTNDVTPQTDVGPNNDLGRENPGTNNTAGENATSLKPVEKEMLDLVNRARADNGAAPLQIDMSVTNVARIKSQDMIDNEYFSHNSPTYGSPFDMLQSFNINYVKAGENIAGNTGVQSAHEALMNSPGHRENILNPDYTHIGIGIQEGGMYGSMFTQLFISKPR
ncbi:putative YkwD family protein [Natranaerovirga hydrolytica]|uniref:Putative YkwD family protein n=1 Tax=Natranaerovirga hydrolytica TaxID=680378 RepID=A0A4R1N0Q7_9FIRM|nr:CAP domain-containing protein [Natranaerovirga hydrolytica]TCK98482.1 putative YkwD family protein [Natranaerovirga hydrolytica]